MLTLASLITPETRDEIVDTLLSVGASIGQKVTAWQPGQPLLQAIMTVATKMAHFSTASVEMVRGGFGDLASGEWLPIWAKEIYDVDEVVAEQATGTSGVATNGSGIEHHIPAKGLIVAHVTTGKTYRNSEAIVVPGTGYLENIAIESDEFGTACNAAPGTIEVVVSTQWTGVAFTNTESVLGADRETPAALRLRTRASLAALSPNGPKDAYNYVATTPELSATATPITRARTVMDDDTGDLSVYIATASGAPISGDVTIVNDAIHLWAEPWTVNATAVAAATVTIAVTYQVWLKGSNLTEAAVELAIESALSTFFAAFPVGGDIIPPATEATVDVDAIRQVIGTATPGIIKVTIALPASDTTLAANEIPVLGTITPTVTFL